METLNWEDEVTAVDIDPLPPVQGKHWDDLESIRARWAPAMTRDNREK